MVQTKYIRCISLKKRPKFKDQEDEYEDKEESNREEEEDRNLKETDM